MLFWRSGKGSIVALPVSFSGVKRQNRGAEWEAEGTPGGAAEAGRLVLLFMKPVSVPKVLDVSVS